MKVERLVVEGIGPFRHRQEVDFAALGASDVFLIDGPTGAGKSTLIDSITFALFGEGEDSTRGRMRSALCEPREPSAVELTFTVGGERYQIRRTPAYDRPKQRGEGTTPEPSRVVLKRWSRHGDELPSVTDNRESGAQIKAALGGLGREQFRQLVVLPQGEFAALLRMKPRDRKAALKDVIGQPIYQRLQRELKEAGDLAAHERESADAEIASIIEQVRGAVTPLEGDDRYDSLIAALQAAEPDHDHAAMTTCLASLLDQLGLDVLEMKKHCAAADERHVAAVQASESAAAAEQAHARAAHARGRLDAALALIGSDRAGADAAALAHARSTLLTQLGGWASHVEWERGAAARARGDRERAEAMEKLDADRASLEGRRAALPAEVVAVRADRDRALQTAAERTRWTTALAEADAAQGHLSRHAEALRAHESVRVSEQEADRAVRAADDLVRARDDDYRELRDRQWQQRAAALAAGLVAGQPCAVCGSLEHPLPAVDADAALVTEELLESAEQRTAAARHELERMRAEHARAKSALDAAAAELAAAEALASGHSPATVNAARETAQVRLDACDAATRASNAAEEVLARLEAERVELEARITQIAASRASLEAEHVEARRAEQEEAAWRSQHAPEVASLADAVDEMSAKAEALGAAVDAFAALDVAVAAMPEQHRGRSPAELQEAAEAARAAQADAMAAKNAATARLAAVSVPFDSVTALSADLKDAIGRSREVLERTGPVIRLAQIVCGRGANIRRTELEDYAMERRFESVLEAASVHLERMSGGRFSFELHREAVGNAHAGLGIAVLDGHSNRRRDPGTLSGGETFYASLSLALGLADVVRGEAGGVPLETLFVDEGFGSLDPNTLQVVMDEISRLQDSGRSVGLISHVEEMKRWISERVRVEPVGNGESRVVLGSESAT